MARLVWALVLLAGAAFGVFWLVTIPRSVDAEAVAGLQGDPVRGAEVFAAAGCAACHSAEGATGEARLVLAGGRAFPSAFGTFYAPNISPDPEAGIGDWNLADLVNAMRYGTSPGGEHYFPAFPYGSYSKITLDDIASLYAYLMTLPTTSAESRPHEIGFPFNIRRSLGGWKLLFQPKGWVVTEISSLQLERGRYLVEAMGHCAECHTPRNPLGGLRTDRWLAGAPSPSGKGRIPNITPGMLDWSEADIAYYLETGFTPEFDTAGGTMAEVIENTALLSAEDRAAIAAYLKAVPPQS